MTINGLDIFADYQEQAQYGKLINWQLLKSDPLNFRFIWIKCSEGTEWKSYVVGAARCVRGAKSVQFEAINPYHFYLFQWCDGAGVWHVMSAVDQANAFHSAAVAAGFLTVHPMVDLEDPLIEQFLAWTDTASANRAIAFARALARHIKAYLEAVTQEFGVKPDCYSGWWWLRYWVPLLVNNGYTSEVAFLNDYKWILADYDGELNYPPMVIEQKNVIAWQRTSTPVPPVKGIPTGHVVPGDALDIDQWMQTEQAYQDWKGGITPPATGAIMTYKQTVKQADRGRFVWLSSDDKQVDIAGVCAGADAALLRMVSQATGDMTVLKDAAFGVWCDRMTKPALGVVELDQNLFWNKEIDLNQFQNPAVRNLWTNETVRAILEQWHVAQIPQAEWDARRLQITAGEGWHPINGLVLLMTTVLAKGSKIEGKWQQAIVDDVVNLLTTLMEGGYIPTVKIYLLASWDWYRAYASDTGWTPAQRIAGGQVAGMGVMRVWGQPAAGLLSEIPMAAPYATLAEVWQNVPEDGYSYPLTLEGIDFQFFVWSFNRLMATSMFYPGASVTPVTCGTWCDTQAEMVKALGVVAPPPVDPGTNPAEVIDVAARARLDALEEKLAAIKALL